MKYNNDFKYDLKLGQVGEKYLGKILSGKLVEVKTDFKATQTGNVFVEYESRGKLSGLSTSKANWYAFIISNDNVILITSSRLKVLCKRYLKTDRDVRGGDSNTSKGILLPLTDIVVN